MKYLSALFAILLLTSCSSFHKDMDNLACPEVGFVRGADSVSLSGIDIFINGYTGSCVFGADEYLNIDVNIPFKATSKTPQNAEGKIENAVVDLEVPYFVAIIDLDENIIEKNIFSVKFDMENRAEAIVEEQHVVNFPKSFLVNVSDYKIVIGFVKTEENSKDKK